MKVDQEPSPAPSPRRPREPFREALHAHQRPAPRGLVERPPGPRAPLPERPGPTPAHPGVRAVAALESVARTRAAAERFHLARRGHDTEAARLGEVRAEGAEQGAFRVEARERDLLRQALLTQETPWGEPLAPPPRPRGPTEEAPGALRETGPAGALGAGGAGAAAAGRSAEPAPPAAAARAEALLALVERIESFARAHRPALALELRGALASRVELERTGPGEVAVTLVPRTSPPSGAELEAIRRQVEARGLRLTRLVLAGSPARLAEG